MLICDFGLSFSDEWEHYQKKIIFNWHIWLLILGIPLSGCSLVTLEGAAEPLTTKEVNLRIMTHEFADHFATSVESTADTISDNAFDFEIRLNAIRWKIYATGGIQDAAFHTTPLGAMVDTWAFCVQMFRYFEEGDGRNIFGENQSLAIHTSQNLLGEFQQLVKSFTTQREYEKYEKFVSDYVL
jgi:hypothetical protein